MCSTVHCEVVIPHMQEGGGGAITFITTTAAVETFGGPQAYNAMKGSLLVYAKQLPKSRERQDPRKLCLGLSTLRAVHGKCLKTLWGNGFQE